MADILEATTVADDAYSRDRQISWFAVYTNIRCERRAELGLKEAGYQTCYPVLKKWVRRPGGRKAPAERPLFARYIFVGVDLQRRDIEPIRNVDGVERIVSKDGTPYGAPASIPAAVVSDLRLAMLRGDFDYTAKRRPAVTFAPGTHVRVAEGPFEGFVGKVKAADSDKRVEILLELFKRHATAIVEASALRVA